MSKDKHKSEKLIEALLAAGVTIPDKGKAQFIIRQFFCNIHSEAVLDASLAHNRPNYVPPQFNDL